MQKWQIGNCQEVPRISCDRRSGSYPAVGKQVTFDLGCCLSFFFSPFVHPPFLLLHRHSSFFFSSGLWPTHSSSGLLSIVNSLSYYQSWYSTFASPPAFSRALTLPHFHQTTSLHIFPIPGKPNHRYQPRTLPKPISTSNGMDISRPTPRTHGL